MATKAPFMTAREALELFRRPDYPACAPWLFTGDDYDIIDADDYTGQASR